MEASPGLKAGKGRGFARPAAAVSNNKGPVKSARHLKKEEEAMKKNENQAAKEEGAEGPNPESSREPEEGTGRALVVYQPPAPPTLDEPDSLIVAQQVAGSLGVPQRIDRELREQLWNETIALYAAIGPRDALESILARLVVATSNAAMDAYRRAAANEEWPQARDVELRNGVKASRATAELINALDNHRGRGQQTVNVGQVKVESGAQAIVGNVGARERPQPAAGSQLLVGQKLEEDQE
jgi:hypothetical protein